MPNLRNPTTGNVQSVPDDQAEALRAQGWGDETVSEGLSREIGVREQEHYTSTGQQILTGLEGAASGATLGLSDLLEGDEAGKRSEYNSGWRLGGELVGALVPSLATLGGGEAEAGGSVLRALAERTPAGMVARAGEGVREAIGGVKGAIVAGGVEGALYGVGGAISHAKLTGDPFTVESFAAGAGTGLLLGAGAGLLGGGLERASKSASESLAAEHAADLLERDSPSLASLGDHVADISAAAQKTLRGAQEALSSSSRDLRAMDAAKESFRPEETLNSLQSSHNDLMSRAGVTTPEGVSVSQVQSDLTTSFRKASRAVATEKDITRLHAALGDYSAAIREASSRLETPMSRGLPKMPVLNEAMRSMTEESGHRAAATIADLGDLPSLLKAVPRTPAQLAAMGDSRWTDFAKGLRQVLNSRAPEMSSASASLKTSIESVLEEHGVTVPHGTGDAVEGLAALRDTFRKTRATAASATAGKSAKTSGFLGWARKTAQRYAGRAGGRAGRTVAGEAGAAAGYEGARLSVGTLLGVGGHPIAGVALMADALGLRSAVTQSTRRILATAGRPLAEGFLRVGPLAARMATSYTGADDNAKDIRQLALNRMREAVALSGSGAHRDMMYAAVQPIATHSPDLATALANHVTGALDYVASVAPKDPGGGGAMLNGRWNSGWQPSRNQAQEFAAVHEAFMAPMEALQRLVSGFFEPAAADALWNMYPTMMARTAADAVTLLSSPDSPRLSMTQRAGLSLALRIPLDGLLRPEAISALQTAYADVPPAPRGGASRATGGPPGRPAATTKVQQLQGNQ